MIMLQLINGLPMGGDEEFDFLPPLQMDQSDPHKRFHPMWPEHYYGDWRDPRSKIIDTDSEQLFSRVKAMHEHDQNPTQNQQAIQPPDRQARLIPILPVNQQTEEHRRLLASKNIYVSEMPKERRMDPLTPQKRPSSKVVMTSPGAAFFVRRALFPGIGTSSGVREASTPSKRARFVDETDKFRD